MEDQSRAELKDQSKSLSLARKKQRDGSLERQASARQDLVSSKRSTCDQTSAKNQAESFPSSKLDSALQDILKKKVHARIEAEQALSTARAQIQFLEEKFQLSDIPKGMKIRQVKAKGKSDELQRKFDSILHEAEIKLLEAAIASKREEVPKLQDSITRSQTDIDAVISKWRSSFPLKDDTSVEKVRLIVETAVKFTEDFYFEYTARSASQALKSALSQEEKKAKKAARMDADFQLTEESIRDIVKAEVKRLGESKGKPAPGVRPSRKQPQSSNNNNRPPSRGGKGQRRRSQSASGRKKNSQGQQSSKGRRVSLPKNSRGRGSGHGT